jgi:hypothetical protein
MNRSRRFIVAMVGLLLGPACSNEPTDDGSQSGTLYLRLATPLADDGALLFEVTGLPVNGAVAVDGSLRLFTWRPDGSTLVGVVLGAITNGAVVALRVPDIGAAAGYTARLVKVADRQDTLRGSLTGYGLTVGP